MLIKWPIADEKRPCLAAEMEVFIICQRTVVDFIVWSYEELTWETFSFVYNDHKL